MAYDRREAAKALDRPALKRRFQGKRGTTIRARRAGVCIGCGQHVRAGTFVVYNGDIRHVLCP